MKTVHIEFDVEIPVDATEDEIDEWLRYMLHDRGNMSADNPLEGNEVEPVNYSFNWRAF
jgi:hypothetical protein